MLRSAQKAISVARASSHHKRNATQQPYNSSVYSRLMLVIASSAVVVCAIGMALLGVALS